MNKDYIIRLREKAIEIGTAVKNYKYGSKYYDDSIVELDEEGIWVIFDEVMSCGCCDGDAYNLLISYDDITTLMAEDIIKKHQLEHDAYLKKEEENKLAAEKKKIENKEARDRILLGELKEKYD